MARFRATVQGGKGETSRLGGIESGIVTVAAGKNIAIEVRAAACGGSMAQLDQFEIIVVNTHTMQKDLVLNVTEQVSGKPRVTFKGER